MANAITLFKKYIDLLDEVYKNASLTSVLESDMTLARAGANANEIIVPKLSMDGLGDYSRNGGYVKGSVTMTNESVQFNFDRGRKFDVDEMDNEETAGLAFGKLASAFIREKVVPEVDAFRFATYGAKAANKVTGALADGNAVLTALITALGAMDDAEVPAESRYLFITPTLYNAVNNVDTTKSRKVLDDFGGRIVKVPQSRFYTVISQLDGSTSGETAGGYAKDATGQNINFMIIEKTALMQYTKHLVNKIIRPEDNQESDGWLFFYRAYALADMYANKTAGVYMHSVA